MKVFYDARQAVKNNASFSPSAGKSALVVEEWKKKGYDFQLGSVNPVTRNDFYLAHDRGLIDGVLDLKRENGFNNCSPEIAASLYWTTGSLLSASVDAIRNKQITCSPTSGFHHSHYDQCQGFCTFNGLIVTAIKLRQSNPKIKIGILDIDMHYGNGTDDIINRLKLNYIHHYTFGGANPDSCFWKGGPKAEKWLKSLPEIVGTFKDCDFVMYQAGADPAKDDPFGGALTNNQLRERDRIVFSGLHGMKKPVTWNLSGGYQNPIQKVLDIHNATIEECLKVVE